MENVNKTLSFGCALTRWHESSNFLTWHFELHGGLGSRFDLDHQQKPQKGHMCQSQGDLRNDVCRLT